MVERIGGFAVMKCVCSNQLKKNQKKFCGGDCQRKYRAFTRPKGLTYEIIAQNKGWFKKTTGKQITDKGYYRISFGKHRGRFEHIVIIEKYLARKLEKDEVVHHINGDKLDNRIENLKVMLKIDHDLLHHGIGRKALCAYL